MKPSFLSVLLISSFLLNFYTTPVSQAAVSNPEAKCFDLLKEAAKGNPNFSNLDLNKVQKINGKNGKFKSSPFSVATYDDFSRTFEREIPFFATDIKYYPDDMDSVPSRYKFKRKVHKSNRNNSASIIYNDGTKTDIDHWMSKNGSSTGADIQGYFAGEKTAAQLDKKHYRQTIDGYYIDSKYVTFGKESSLALSFPSRAARPDNDGYYPVGRPIKDMREYLMYTHYLKSSLGGDFLSCELFKMVPLSGFKLKDYDYSGKSIAWENYGGSRMSQTNSKVKTVGGGDFRQAEVEYTASNRQDRKKDLLRFYGINISYDNGSDFLNPFITTKLFDESVKDAKVATQSFRTMRQDFYQRVIDSGLLIGQDVAPTGAQLTTTEFLHYDVARENLPGLKLSGKATYYMPDQLTADKVCQAKGFKSGQWSGGTQTATSPGWAYSNLAIRGWNGSKAYTKCNTGSACIAQSETYRGKIKCSTYGTTPPSNTSKNLYLGTHTEKNCTDAGGAVVAAGSNKVCRFGGSACASGWTQLGQWSVTTSQSCGTSNCNVTPCLAYGGGKGETCVSWGPTTVATCTTGSHNWANTATETCAAQTGTGSGKGNNLNCSATTCTANITQTGCY